MRRMFTIGLIGIAVVAMISTGFAKSDFLKEFETNYDLLLTSLETKPPAEIAEISDFVYQKDRMTFTFKTGRLYLLRYVLDRPTTAVFIGEGHAAMTVPMRAERASLKGCSKKDSVDENFEVCFIRFADDFDLKLREKFTFEDTNLPWRDFNMVSQGEFFFKPVVMHEYDPLFQILRSLYERREDGLFFIDFNRYMFTFDPNRPEQVIQAYEDEGGDLESTIGALFQRQELDIVDDSQLSDISFPTTLVHRKAWLRMKGLDGKYIDSADVQIKMVINADSLKFLSLFLHYNFKLDSIYYNGALLDYHRRGDFTFVGLILPKYAHKNDTLDIRLWYRGKDFGSPLPFVADPTPTPLELTFNVEKNYNYLMPAKGERRDAGRGRVEFDVVPDQPYQNFQFQPLATGYDTLNFVADVGINFNILQSSSIRKNDYACFIPDESFQPAVLGAFNFMTGRLGMPPATFEMFVYPDSTLTMPGLMEVSQVKCLKEEEGGIHMFGGKEAARQWFGNLTRPASDREFWLLDGVPDYLSLMYVQQGLSANIFFGELGRRRNHVYTTVERNWDLPLSGGKRVESTHRTAKACWVVHMLRFLMYDLDKSSDRSFLKFVHELSMLVNSRMFKNKDIIELAEKHYGDSLDWFFNHWLYDRDLPEYNVKYTMAKRDGGNYLDIDVEVKKVADDFTFPVVMRVEDVNGGSTYHREFIPARTSTVSLGPFEVEPKELIFNEFYSVLCKQSVSKK